MLTDIQRHKLSHLHKPSRCQQTIFISCSKISNGISLFSVSVVRNAFRIYTPRRSWICQTEDFNDKFNWITLLENTVRAALEDLD